MAGGASSANYGHWTNWLVAIITLAIVTFLNHFTKGFVKLASILIGIICGYIIAACFGMVDLTAVAQASVFQMPQIMHFGIQFDPPPALPLDYYLPSMRFRPSAILRQQQPVVWTVSRQIKN